MTTADVLRRWKQRRYYRENRRRRAAQRLASKYGDCQSWRDYLR